MNRRVVVTGFGAITPLGLDANSTWEALITGKSGADYITKFDTSNIETKIAAEVKGFDPAQYIDRKEARRMDRYIQLAVAATAQAFQQANLKVDAGNADEIGVIIGSGIGGISTLSDQFKVFFDRGPSRVSPFLVTMMINNMAAGHTAIAFGLRGPNFAVVSACATGAHAIGEAYHTIRRGDAIAMIAGGSEAAVVPLGIAAFNNMRALSVRNDEPARASRPFDAERDGFVLGEGGCVLLLEDREYALRRGAEPLAEVVGYGASSDASHVTAPADGGAGAALAMRRALRSAGLEPGAIDYINAHGTSTQLNDKTETEAIKSVFGQLAYKIPVSSIKSMTGHLLAAAGSLEAFTCIQVIRTGIIPPTINYEHADPDCDLDYVPNVARKAGVDIAMSNSMGFGGHNVSLILARAT
ncbi:MAG: beta-ketoacyl-ACP synthase II [Bacteroidetes bacterium]|nr:beta-ketoacyl-ACP synthase II [Bacteroidota bacterium]MCL5026016.1 beta-ketoacyl-ACP synthase II [Chloroflexota bacterium]